MENNSDVFFQGIDLNALINQEIQRNNASSIFTVLIFYKGLTKIIKSSPKLRIIFHPFEGQSWEKVITLAIADSRRNIKTFGYQHSAFSELHLSNFCSSEEYSLGTMPDYILANSEYNRNKLGKDGFPPERILTIGDLRFGYLNENRQDSKISTNNFYKTILVCLSINIDESLMALQECCIVFRNLKQKRFQFKAYIKPHPFRPFNMGKLSFTKGLEAQLKYYDGELKPNPR